MMEKGEAGHAVLQKAGFVKDREAIGLFVMVNHGLLIPV